MYTELQVNKAVTFKALHERAGIFAFPNPWDAGSAKMLTSLGFEALATTSAGLAFSLGKPDGEGALTRAETLANARAIVEATPLPVAADLENGYGDQPGECAATILLAAEAGLSLSLYIDRQGRKFDLWPARSERYHPAAGSLCGGGSRCTLCPGPQK